MPSEFAAMMSPWATSEPVPSSAAQDSGTITKVTVAKTIRAMARCAITELDRVSSWSRTCVSRRRQRGFERDESALASEAGHGL